MVSIKRGFGFRLTEREDACPEPVPIEEDNLLEVYKGEGSVRMRLELGLGTRQIERVPACL